MIVSGQPHEWARVAERVRERRENELGLTREELIARSGGTVKMSSVYQVEKGQKLTYTRANLRAISQALGWSRESIEAIKDGGQPVEEQPALPTTDLLHAIDSDPYLEESEKGLIRYMYQQALRRRSV